MLQVGLVHQQRSQIKIDDPSPVNSDTFSWLYFFHAHNRRLKLLLSVASSTFFLCQFQGLLMTAVIETLTI